MTAILLGLLLGMRHALDADHIVAVTAIVSRERSFARAARVGMLWGVGHTTTIFMVGGAIVAFRLVVPERVALGFEFLVALMLIVLGLLNLSKLRNAAPVPSMPPMLVGLVHGLAGSAAVALLVLAAIPGVGGGLIYLLVFGLGTIGGMMAVTSTLAFSARIAVDRLPLVRRYVQAGAGVLSLVFGLILAQRTWPV
ncbi:MAG TPA: hypothetical protein VE967_01210 [Gemmatimonadaceae bacterium]|nr:hypothetical protein [Gemmatimonadaceae bacterium]